MKKTGALATWGIDNSKEIEQWSAGICLKEERYFTQFDDIDRLRWRYRFAFRIASLIPAIRRAHRILYYTM